MNRIFWILASAITGWLIGILLRDKGYGKVLSTSCTRSLDILFGVVGASILQYIFFWAVAGTDPVFSNYGIAVLGATSLVAFCRFVSERYFRSPSYRGMSRAAFIKWHESLTMKELATWKPPSKAGPTTPSETRSP